MKSDRLCLSAEAKHCLLGEHRPQSRRAGKYHHVSVKQNGIAIVVTALPDKRKCPISLPFLSTTTLPWLPYAACGRSVKCLQGQQRIRSCIMSCSYYAQALVGIYSLCSSPLWEFDGSPMECFHHAVSLPTMLRVIWLLRSPQQPSRATDATKLTPAEGIIASASLAGHD